MASSVAATFTSRAGVAWIHRRRFGWQSRFLKMPAGFASCAQTQDQPVDARPSDTK